LHLRERKSSIFAKLIYRRHSRFILTDTCRIRHVSVRMKTKEERKKENTQNKRETEKQTIKQTNFIKEDKIINCIRRVRISQAFQCLAIVMKLHE
jgi:hypothetical protein